MSNVKTEEMDRFKKKYELILNLIAATHQRIPSTFNNTL